MKKQTFLRSIGRGFEALERRELLAADLFATDFNLVNEPFEVPFGGSFDTQVVMRVGGRDLDGVSYEIGSAGGATVEVNGVVQDYDVVRDFPANHVEVFDVTVRMPDGIVDPKVDPQAFVDAFAPREYDEYFWNNSTSLIAHLNPEGTAFVVTPMSFVRDAGLRAIAGLPDNEMIQVFEDPTYEVGPLPDLSVVTEEDAILGNFCVVPKPTNYTPGVESVTDETLIYGPVQEIVPLPEVEAESLVVYGPVQDTPEFIVDESIVVNVTVEELPDVLGAVDDAEATDEVFAGIGNDDDSDGKVVDLLIGDLVDEAINAIV